MEIRWSARLEQARSVWSIWSLWLIWFVSFVWLNQTDQINEMEQRDHLIASIPCAWSEPHWYLLGPVAIRYSGNQVHCSRTPHVPFSVRQIFPKLSMFLRKYSGMRVRCQGLLFAVPQCESNWMVCAVPCAGWGVHDASRSSFCCGRSNSDRSDTHL